MGPRPSVRPDAFDHDNGLGARFPAVAQRASGQLPDPLSVRCVEGDVRAVETQPDVGGLSAGVEYVAGEPHDGRSRYDIEPVAVSSKFHFPAELGRRRPHWSAHSQYSQRVDYEMSSTADVFSRPTRVPVCANATPSTVDA